MTDHPTWTRQGIDERAATLRMPRKLWKRLRKLSPQARLLWVVGELICDDTGHVGKDLLASARFNPYIVGTARKLADEWGLS